MDWRGRRGSRNIEDRRNQGATRGTGGGAGRGGGVAMGGVGALILLLTGAYFGVDVSGLLDGGGQTAPGGGDMAGADQEAGEFVSVVLADTEEVWATIFPDQVGKAYLPPVLVLYSGVTPSPCGSASGATGPFYCPGDSKIYLDTGFFRAMAQELDARGDFAAAYVVAHEVAHGVQDQLGILSRANQIRAQSSETDSNAISVRIELQADCLSGIWARGAEEMFASLHGGDVEEAVNAASKIGDDTLQRNAGRVPMPHTFTHGTSEQRARWFIRGYESGDMGTCDTFAASSL